MSASVNRATILGNLGQDPEVRATPSGVKVVTMSVATSEKWRDKNTGEQKERTEWHRVTVWGTSEHDGLAGVAEKFLKKGSKVYLSGQIETRKWTDQQGIDRYSTEIVLRGFGSELVLLDSQPSNRPPPPDDPNAYGRTSTRPSASEGNMGRDDEDSIPF